MEKEMATHSSVLARGNPMDRGAWPAIVHGVARVGHDLVTKQQISYSCLLPGQQLQYLRFLGVLLVIIYF